MLNGIIYVGSFTQLFYICSTKWAQLQKIADVLAFVSFRAALIRHQCSLLTQAEPRPMPNCLLGMFCLWSTPAVQQTLYGKKKMAALCSITLNYSGVRHKVLFWFITPPKHCRKHMVFQRYRCLAYIIWCCEGFTNSVPLMIYF